LIRGGAGQGFGKTYEQGCSRLSFGQINMFHALLICWLITGILTMLEALRLATNSFYARGSSPEKRCTVREPGEFGAISPKKWVAANPDSASITNRALNLELVRIRRSRPEGIAMLDPQPKLLFRFLLAYSNGRRVEVIEADADCAHTSKGIALRIGFAGSDSDCSLDDSQRSKQLATAYELYVNDPDEADERVRWVEPEL
jgi:hypothetical protein